MQAASTADKLPILQTHAATCMQQVFCGIHSNGAHGKPPVFAGFARPYRPDRATARHPLDRPYITASARLAIGVHSLRAVTVATIHASGTYAQCAPVLCRPVAQQKIIQALPYFRLCRVPQKHHRLHTPALFASAQSDDLTLQTVGLHIHTRHQQKNAAGQRMDAVVLAARQQLLVIRAVSCLFVGQAQHRVVKRFEFFRLVLRVQPFLGNRTQTHPRAVQLADVKAFALALWVGVHPMASLHHLRPLRLTVHAPAIRAAQLAGFRVVSVDDEVDKFQPVPLSAMRARHMQIRLAARLEILVYAREHLHARAGYVQDLSVPKIAGARDSQIAGVALIARAGRVTVFFVENQHTNRTAGQRRGRVAARHGQVAARKLFVQQGITAVAALVINQPLQAGTIPQHGRQPVFTE